MNFPRELHHILINLVPALNAEATLDFPAMYFRFGAAIVLVVAISVIGVALEKQSLSYRRQISQQRYRMDALVEQYAQLRLKAQQLGAPSRTIKSLEANGDFKLPKRAAQAGPRTTLAIPRVADGTYGINGNYEF